MNEMSLIETLKKFDALRSEDDNIKGGSLERHAPTFGQWPSLLDHRLLDALSGRPPYKHQADAVEKSIGGENIVLESPTASGKTLAFLVPMLDTLLRDKNAKALLLYPMKALAYDQRNQINEICQQLQGAKIESWPYDGNTDEEHRQVIRQSPPQILMTNPEYLHSSFLGHHDKWQNKFLSNLRFLVIDEIHEYRGYFGSNVALLLRRFLLKLNRLNTNPRLFLSTATCANPQDHAEALTGKRFALVSARTAMRPKRNFFFINPVKIPDFRFLEIFRHRVINAAFACLSQNISVLVFCPSVKFAEKSCNLAQREAQEKGLDSSCITSFSAGLLPRTKTEIQDGLKNGKYKVVFSTNALELGIDIGGLDGIILAGFPDSIMSAWQRIGRAGRSWEKDAHVLFYPMNNAVDRFFAENLNAFLDKPLDHIFVDPQNEDAVEKQAESFLYETALKNGEWQIESKDEADLGEKFFSAIKARAGKGSPVRNYHPHRYLDIRGSGGSVTKLKHKGEDIGTISETRKFREAYIGAVLIHHGKRYQVRAHAAEEIELEEAPPHVETKPGFFTVVNPDVHFAGRRYDGRVVLFYGRLTIIERFTGYQLMDEKAGTSERKGTTSDAKFHNRHAFWIELEPGVEASREAVSALEQIFRIGAIFIIPLDRHDADSFSKEREVYFYENYSGGIGIAKRAIDIVPEILNKGIEIAEQCSCKKGCPNCIIPPRLPDDTEIDKQEGIALARSILSTLNSDDVEMFDKGIWQKQSSGEQ